MFAENAKFSLASSAIVFDNIIRNSLNRGKIANYHRRQTPLPMVKYCVDVGVESELGTNPSRI